jgi:uncharacterized alkaline shock family protein YloU
VTDIERNEQGRIAISRRALLRLVEEAAAQAGSARLHRPRRSLRLELAGGVARVSLELTVRRGEALPEVARAVQGRVAEALEEALEARVAAVDVTVAEVR